MKKYKRLTKDKPFEDIDLKDEWGYLHIYKRLQYLENKIENGTLIELPCKVGDTIYSIPFCEPYEIFEHKVSSLRFISKTQDGCYIDNSFNWFGENIFKTKAEAEKKLKELKGE